MASIVFILVPIGPGAVTICYDKRDRHKYIGRGSGDVWRGWSIDAAVLWSTDVGGAGGCFKHNREDIYVVPIAVGTQTALIGRVTRPVIECMSLVLTHSKLDLAWLTVLHVAMVIVSID